MLNARPIRFVLGVLLLWTGGRVWMLMDSPMAQKSGIELAARFAPVARPMHRSMPMSDLAQAYMPAERTHRERSTISYRAPLPALRFTPSRPTTEAASGTSSAASPAPAIPLAVADPRVAAPRGANRWSGYGWVFAREGGTPGLAGGGQLGGSQAGLRLDYRLTDTLALTGRASAPLETRRGAEAAIGLSWRPRPELPLTIIAERRIGLDRGGRDAFALMAAGGVGPVLLPEKFQLESYAQAGIVGAHRRDGFVDGAATLLRPVKKGDHVAAMVGVGLWGAAQPDVTRLDIGPRLKLRLGEGNTALGIALDWRLRIAGNAHPDSGLAVTLDGSF